MYIHVCRDNFAFYVPALCYFPHTPLTCFGWIQMTLLCINGGFWNSLGYYLRSDVRHLHYALSTKNKD